MGRITRATLEIVVAMLTVGNLPGRYSLPRGQYRRPRVRGLRLGA
jgi:hypothetical protein